VSRGKKEPTDAAFQQFLRHTPGTDPNYPTYNPWGAAYDHYLSFLSLEGYPVGSANNGTDAQLLRRTKTVNQILRDYDFIGISERLDESLVALQMILGLKTSDILYYSAKNEGSWDDLGVFIQPSFVSSGMERFFASPEWKELSKGDYLMYLAANASLDRTIESLGRTEFHDKLASFRRAKQLVLTHCPPIRSFYSAAGKTWETDCLLADAGCGSQCFDQLEREFGI
jgi:hypothetical protein